MKQFCNLYARSNKQFIYQRLIISIYLLSISTIKWCNYEQYLSIPFHPLQLTCLTFSLYRDDPTRLFVFFELNKIETKKEKGGRKRTIEKRQIIFLAFNFRASIARETLSSLVLRQRFLFLSFSFFFFFYDRPESYLSVSASCEAYR